MGKETLLPFSFERVLRAVELVESRLRRGVGALEKSGIDYAIIGANAVAAHVACVDPEAVRATPNVDLLIQRDDLRRADAALIAGGFVAQPTRGDGVYHDGDEGSRRARLRLFFAGEQIRPADVEPMPCAVHSVRLNDMRVTPLRDLVRMKLVANRTIDRTHLRDMIDVGLIDETWPTRFSPVLGERLQQLLDDPNG